MLLNFKQFTPGRAGRQGGIRKQTNKPTKKNHPPKKPNTHLKENGAGGKDFFGGNIDSLGGCLWFYFVRGESSLNARREKNIA